MRIYNCRTSSEERVKQNKAEFDWEINCLNRILKYVTRHLLTNHWENPADLSLKQQKYRF